MIDTRALALVLGLAVLAGGSWWLARGVAPAAAPADPRTRHDPDYAIQNFTATVMNHAGRRQYVLAAQRLLHYPDDDTAHLERPHLVQYPETGAPIHTTADTGLIPGGAKEIFMQGNVRVRRGADARSAGGVVTAESMRIELDR